MAALKGENTTSTLALDAKFETEIISSTMHCFYGYYKDKLLSLKLEGWDDLPNGSSDDGHDTSL